MREYIVNLTNNLIGKHTFDKIFETMKAQAKNNWRDEFVQFVSLNLWLGDVDEMSPETLGKIMCLSEGCDIPKYAMPAMSGNPERYLRNIVSNVLALQIWYRLDRDVLKHPETVPPYR